MKTNDPYDFFSEDAIRRLDEDIEWCSEKRVERLKCQSHGVFAVSSATSDFELENGLEVEVLRHQKDIPDIQIIANFKYTIHSIYDVLPMVKDVDVVLVREKRLLIGYGFASSDKNGEMKVDIIDVDLYSRRESGFLKRIMLEGKGFEIGVGHV